MAIIFSAFCYFIVYDGLLNTHVKHSSRPHFSSFYCTILTCFILSTLAIVCSAQINKEGAERRFSANILQFRCGTTSKEHSVFGQGSYFVRYIPRMISVETKKKKKKSLFSCTVRKTVVGILVTTPHNDNSSKQSLSPWSIFN